MEKNEIFSKRGKGLIPLGKILRIMKVLTILMLVFVMHISARSYSQNSKLSLSMQNVSIKQILERIEDQSEFRFLYSDSKINVEKKIDVDFTNSSIENILSYIFKVSGITSKIVDRQILLSTELENVSILTQQQKSISGKVTDSTGGGLPGVSVVVKGTTNGTITDSNGNYSINNVQEKSILQFSFVGMKKQEILAGSKAKIDVLLLEDAIGLDEVVAVGYGTMKKSDLAGATASMKGDDLQNTPANTLVQSLQGRASGVDIKTASNAPGGDIRIRIRGTNSINASSEPLYVIDGFPIDNNNTAPQGAGNSAQSSSPLSSISPSEIESIEILKDASATAIYGSRGANGVVLVTTKNGKAGKAKVDFDYSLNIASVRKKLDLCNAEELAILTNEYCTNNALPLIYNGITKPLPKDLGEGTDWQNAIFRTALTHNYNLSVSGGTEKAKYLVVGSYLDQDGIIIESNFKRYSLRFNLDQTISDRVKMGVNMSANRSVNDAVPSDGTGYQNDSPLWSALATTPVIPIMDANGNYVHNYSEANKILENPVSIAKTRTDITYTNRILTNAFTDITITNGFTFRANFGADLINSKRNVYIPNTAQIQALPNLGVASIGTVQSLTWLSEYTLNYKKDFGVDHRFSAMAGYTAQGTNIESVFSETDDFFSNKFEFNNLGVGANPRPSASSTIDNGLLSYIGRLNYAYKDKYLFTGTVRQDGSSKFGVDNKWGTFPSAALAWRASQENFLKSSKIISDLKFRSSYGLTGNQNIGSYSSLALYNTTRIVMGGLPIVGLVPGRIPNPALKWEKTAQFDLGFDAVLLNGKFNLSADYYIKKTKDLLLDVTIPNQSGYLSSVQNIGEVENKGFEFSISLNEAFGNIKWNSTFNMSFNRNKLISLPEGTNRLIFGIGRGESAVGSSIALPGKPLGQFFGYHFLGIWQTNEEIIAAGNVVGGVNRPGLPKYADLNGDGFKQNDDDREVIGDPNPDFIYGFSNDFTYKNFKLSIFINGSYGNKIANLNRIGLLTSPQKHNVLQIYYDQRWTGPGTSNTIEAALINAGEWKNFSDRDIEDGSYLRVKNISLSYNLPLKTYGIRWINNTQIYVAGENLITLTKYTGFDPEVDLYSTSNVSMGVDNGAYPSSKIIRFGVKLGF